jgi:hypothetical protein
MWFYHMEDMCSIFELEFLPTGSSSRSAFEIVTVWWCYTLFVRREGTPRGFLLALACFILLNKTGPVCHFYIYGGLGGILPCGSF